MEIWLATGDETGDWDIVDGSFGSDFVGLAWTLGPVRVWENALQMPVGNVSALEAFSQPINDRLKGVRLSKNSSKYHLMDVWLGYCKGKGFDNIPLDVRQEDPVLELLRSDAEWLLRQSGLGVLTVGGGAADAKAAGLGLSGDGLRERAKAFAGLMTAAMPFLPGDAKLNLMAEGRTEIEIADAVKACRFMEYTNPNRKEEPFRDFLGRLTEDLRRAASRCRSSVSKGTVVDNIFCMGGRPLEQFFAEKLRGAPFLKANAAKSVAAMKGIADLAAALLPRPQGSDCCLVVPPGFSDSIWCRNFRDLRDAFDI